MSGRIWFYILICLTVASAQTGMTEEIQPKKKAKVEKQNVVIITAGKMIYDSEKQSAVFEGNVIVSDQELLLKADNLTAKFDKNSKVQYIHAEGNVYIEQDDKTAWSKSATYDAVSGKMVLEGDPLIKQGKDMLQGDVITFWRDDNKMICEPNARLTIFTDGKDAGKELTGKK